jgi:hypothetical protein
MNYTPEQLRKWADGLYRLRGPVISLKEQAAQLRAHAAALEELAPLREKAKGAKEAKERYEDGVDCYEDCYEAGYLARLQGESK